MSRRNTMVVSLEPEKLPAVCPCTGLSVRHQANWVYTSAEKTYRTTIALIGDNIFWVIPRGYVTETDMQQAVIMATAILDETLPGGDPFVFIEDFSHTRGGTAAARRLYLDFTNSLDGLLGSFPYGMPPFFRLSFNLSRRLQLHRYRVHMVARYDDAITAAVDLLSQHGLPPIAAVPPPRTCQTDLSNRDARDGDTADVPDAPGPINDLDGHVDSLLAYLGRLDLETTGLPELPDAVRGTPMQPVYEALELLKMDMDQFLDEHQALVFGLHARRHELVTKTETIENRNCQLQSLLHQSSEDQSELGEIALQNIQTLVKPIIGLIEGEARRSDQHGWISGLKNRLDELLKSLAAHLELHRHQLTPQEIRIARLIRNGARSKAIAGQLGISVRTVESFRGRLREKLGIKGRRRNLRTALLLIHDKPLSSDDVMDLETGQGMLDQ